MFVGSILIAVGYQIGADSMWDEAGRHGFAEHNRTNGVWQWRTQ